MVQGASHVLLFLVLATIGSRTIPPSMTASPHLAPPRATASWGRWQPPSPEELHSLELGFARTIEERSLLLEEDHTERLAYQGSCDLGHMSRCTLCPSQMAAHAQVHANATSASLLARGPALMVDDRPLRSWARIRRVLRPPTTRRLHGVAIEQYCTAMVDEGEVFVLVERRTVFRSGDGFHWHRTGKVAYTPDAGYDACLSRVDDGRGHGPAYVVVGDGATPCATRQPRLWSARPKRTEAASGFVARAFTLGDHRPFRMPPWCRKRPRPWEQISTNWTLVGAGGDTCSRVHHSAVLGADVLATRHNFCALRPDGRPRWREIRGLELRSTPSVRALGQATKPADALFPRVLSAFLDLEGNAERYRHQLYSLAVTSYPDTARGAEAGAGVSGAAVGSRAGGYGGTRTDGAGAAEPPLFLGSLVVLNYPKADAVSTFRHNCSALRAGHRMCDTMDIHLVHSRDGVHFDYGWVYARTPLVQRGTDRGAGDAGCVINCGPPLFAKGNIWQFYNGFPGNHEHKGQPHPRVAQWPMHALVGLEPEGPSADGEVWTKPVRLSASREALVFLVEPLPQASTAWSVFVPRPPVPVVDVVLVRAEGLDVRSRTGEELTTSGAHLLPGQGLCTLRVAPLVDWAHTPAFDVVARITFRNARLYAIGHGHHFAGDHAHRKCSN